MILHLCILFIYMDSVDMVWVGKRGFRAVFEPVSQ